MSKKKNKVKNKQTKSYSPINQHQQKGKTFIPPFMQMPAPVKLTSWVNDRLPEYLWAVLLITHLERSLALSIFREVGDYGKNVPGDPSNFDISLSKLSTLEPKHLQNIMDIVCRRPDSRIALRPLLLFSELPAKEYWHKAINDTPNEDDWTKLQTTILRTFDHQSQESTDCRWLRVVALIMSGKLVMNENLTKVLHQILNYPHHGDMRSVRPAIRSIEGTFAHMQVDFSWATSFWKNCFELTPCMELLEQKKEIDNEQYQFLFSVVDDLYESLINNFQKTTNTTSIDAKHDAVFGIALYSLSISKELMNVKNEYSILGRLGLRAIMEAYINLAFLLYKNEQDLWQAYRNYGNGQAKLAFLKLDELEKKPNFVDIETLEALANEDMWMEFQSIEVGQWAKSDLRTISTTVGLKETYDTYYSLTSAFSHAQWSPVRNTVFQTCLNPLHRLHRIPSHGPRQHPSVLHDAYTLITKILELVQEAYPAAVFEKTDIPPSDQTTAKDE